MAPKDTTKGTKSAPASAPPDGAASKSGVAEKVAADVAAATAQVVVFPKLCVCVCTEPLALLAQLMDQASYCRDCASAHALALSHHVFPFYSA